MQVVISFFRSILVFFGLIKPEEKFTTYDIESTGDKFLVSSTTGEIGTRTTTHKYESEPSLTAEEVKQMLEPIPAENFIEHSFTDGDSKCCVMGHITRLLSPNPSDYSPNNCSDFYGGENWRTKANKFRAMTNHLFENFGDIVEANNYSSDKFPQADPKSRSMAFLDKMIEEQMLKA